VDVNSASRDIASALKDIMKTKGYTTLILVRGQSDLTPDQIRSLADEVTQVVFKPTSDAPLYLQNIYRLQEEALRNGTTRTYIRIGTGLYGEISVVFWGPKPTLNDLVEVAKYIRSRTGICGGTLYIKYAGTSLPVDMLLPYVGPQSHKPTINPDNSNNDYDSAFLYIIPLVTIPLVAGLLIVKKAIY